MFTEQKREVSSLICAKLSDYSDLFLVISGDKSLMCVCLATGYAVACV